MALGLGVVAGDPTPGQFAILGVAIGLSALIAALAFPWCGYLALVSSSMMLVVVLIAHLRAANLFDMLLAPVLLSTALTLWRPGMRPDLWFEALRGHSAIQAAERRFVHSAQLYFLVAIASLLPGLVMGRQAQSLDSALLLIRGLQGVLLYPLGMALVRSERRLNQTMAALLAGGFFFAVINGFALASGVQRAGITWVVNTPVWPINSPNEGATAMLMLWVLLIARQMARRQMSNLILLPLVLLMLVLTQSRSGLLAWLTFNALMLRRTRLGHLLVGLVVIGIAIPFIPAEYWGRLSRTLVLKAGSYEAYSALVRVYGWNAAWRVFLDHPTLGVGYMCFRFVSSSYHDLPFMITTAENMFLEIATGMGLVGLIAALACIIRMFRLGLEIQRASPAGTLGHQLARCNGPFLASLLVANLTADSWTGMISLGQLAIWLVLLVRAGQFAALKNAAT